MKDSFEAAGAAAAERLAAQFAGVAGNLVVSGDSTELTLAISARLPAMMRGLEPSFRLIDLYRAGRKDELAGQLERELRGPIRPQIVHLAWPLVLAAKRDGIDLIAICHAERTLADAWTFALADPAQGFSDAEWRDFLALLELGADQITTDEAIATERGFLRRHGAG